MGTRSLTRWFEESREGRSSFEIVTMYRQFDGYPSAHGQDLFGFLKDIVMVNGIRLDEKRPIANGAGCLAGQGITWFKIGDAADPVVKGGGKRVEGLSHTLRAGNIYLYPPKTHDVGEEYVYEVRPQGEGKEIRVKVTTPGWTEHDYTKKSPYPVKKVHPEKVLFDGTVTEMGVWLSSPNVDNPEEG